MTQQLVYGWTNPAAGTAATNKNIGFTVSEITVTNITSGGQFYWNSSMTDAYFVTVAAGTVGTSNGFTPLSQSTAIGATISGFTNASPGVLTVNDTATFGFAAGDTIKVVDLADNATGTNSLNNTFTVASVTATTITTATDTSVTGYSVYVSGGRVVRVSDTNGVPIQTQNLAIEGITLGTSVVGSNSDVMVAVATGENVVN